MFGLGLAELVIVALVLAVPVLVVTLLVVLLAAHRSPVAATREWRLVQLTRLAGVGVGVLAAWTVVQRGSYGVGVMLAPAVFGLCLLLASALGETVVRPRRSTGVRSASLAPRRVRDYLPRATTAMVATASVLLLATMVLTTWTASDDAGTGGYRQLSCQTATHGSSHGPYPGSYYTGPLAALLLAVVVVAGLAAHRVVRRPRGMAATESGDDALRRRSLDVIVSATGIAVCAPYAGVALTAGIALNSLATARPSCAAAWMHPVGVALLLCALLALVAALVCGARLLLGSAQLPDDATPRGASSRPREAPIAP